VHRERERIFVKVRSFSSLIQRTAGMTPRKDWTTPQLIGSASSIVLPRDELPAAWAGTEIPRHTERGNRPALKPTPLGGPMIAALPSRWHTQH